MTFTLLTQMAIFSSHLKQQHLTLLTTPFSSGHFPPLISLTIFSPGFLPISFLIFSQFFAPSFSAIWVLFFFFLSISVLVAPGLGDKSELQLIWAALVIYTEACGNTGSLTHLERPGIKPILSWTLCQVFNLLNHNGNSCNLNSWYKHTPGLSSWIFFLIFIYFFRLSHKVSWF